MQAAQLQAQGQANALQFQRQVWQQQQANLQPYLQAGYGGLANLSYLMGVGQNPYAGQQQTGVSPGGVPYTRTPAAPAGTPSAPILRPTGGVTNKISSPGGGIPIDRPVSVGAFPGQVPVGTQPAAQPAGFGGIPILAPPRDQPVSVPGQAPVGIQPVSVPGQAPTRRAIQQGSPAYGAAAGIASDINSIINPSAGNQTAPSYPSGYPSSAYPDLGPLPPWTYGGLNPPGTPIPGQPGTQTNTANLSSMVNPNVGAYGQLTQPWTGQFQAPTAEQAAQTPGYQFTVDQTMQALQRSAAAQGNLMTGGTMKEMANYASGLASTNYQQTYNNAFQNYLQNYNQFQTNQTNLYNRFANMAGIGQTTGGQLAQLGSNAAQNIAGTYMTGAAQQAQALQNAAAAQAYGYMGGANAWAGGLNNISNVGGQLGMLNYMNNMTGPSATDQAIQQAQSAGAFDIPV